jgi:Flp pilus assembly protein TadG
MLKRTQKKLSRLSRTPWRQRGQAAALFAVGLPVLAGAAALGTDVSVYYYNWYRVRAAVDAAVLSGANFLPNFSTTASSTAVTYATSNGVQSSEISGPTFNAGYTTISMTANRTVPLYLARVASLSSGQLSVSATAQVTAVGTVNGGIAPIGIDSRLIYTYGQDVPLMKGVGPGNWSAFSLTGDGASTYLSDVEHGYAGTLSVGQSIETQPGNFVNQTSSTATGFQYRYNLDPSATLANHTLTSPRVITVPIVNWLAANTLPNGRSWVPIVGFAELWIESSSAVNQATNTISATFIQQVAANTIPGASGAANYGTMTIQLTQ